MNKPTIFSQINDTSHAPLAARMRPRTLSEYIGQDHIMAKGRLLQRAISQDLLSSVIFYGPPGTGKTTLAKVIANTTKSTFVSLNAVLSGVKDIREEIENARERLNMYAQKTILFVDEVHRWNKSQQDALLPWVENGTFILIGATTENPYFEVNAALVSRSRVFQLKLLEEKDLRLIAEQALQDKERGYGLLDVSFTEGALEHIIDIANGDARSLLNALQLAVETSEKIDNKIIITKEVAEESIQKKVVLYDKEGDYHFDVISAFIKSIRGSDPDATMYWLAKMVYAGEDPKFIFRRMMISACEDIGLAEPNAINIVTSCAQAFDRIGLPEGRFHLAHAALYLSTCKKSNSSLCFFDALQDVQTQAEVPNALKDASRDSNAFGHGKGYLYPHAYKDHWVSQQYLPDDLKGKVYYHPSNQGYEDSIKNEVERKRESQLEALSDDNYIEGLSFSPNNKTEENYLARASSNGSVLLLEIRDKLFQDNKIKRHDNILILGASHGLLVWEAIKYNPEGLTLATCNKKSEIEYINHYKNNLSLLRQPELYLHKDLETKLDPTLYFEHIYVRNIDVDIDFLIKHLTLDGKINIVSSIKNKGSRLSDYIEDENTKAILKSAEEKIFNYKEAEDYSSLFENTQTEEIEQYEDKILNKTTLANWIDKTYVPNLSKEDALIIRDSKHLVKLINKEIKFKHIVKITKYSNVIVTDEISKNEWKKVHVKTKL